MNETIKKGDFVEVSFTGKLADTKEVFDTTDEDVAKEAGLEYKPGELTNKIICVGERHILKGLDDMIENLKIGEEKNILLSQEDAFGKRDASLIKLIPTSHFKKQGIRPEPGIKVAINNTLGIVKTVSGARTLVDLNNPLAGRDVEYSLKIISKVDDPAVQASWVMKNEMGFDAEFVKEGENLKVKLPDGLPEDIIKSIKERILKIVRSVKGISVMKKEKDNTSEKQKAENKKSGENIKEIDSTEVKKQ